MARTLPLGPPRWRVEAVREERIGAAVLARQPWHNAPPERLAEAALDGLRQIGLNLSPAAQSLANRVEMLRRGRPICRTFRWQGFCPIWTTGSCRISRDDAQPPNCGRSIFSPALEGRLSWQQRQNLDRLAPARFRTPLGRSIAIDYRGQAPAIAVRLQEMFGLTRHPTVGADALPLQITLLSPAGRPLQVTQDLARLLGELIRDVRKDMRGRYPKHPWPEDPTRALPTLRAKPKRAETRAPACAIYGPIYDCQNAGIGAIRHFEFSEMSHAHTYSVD